MPRLINQILQYLQSGTSRLLLLAGFILLVWGIFSPVGTLVWWLKQDSETLNTQRNRPKTSSSSQDSAAPESPSTIDCYIVFLTGVGDFSTNQLTSGEKEFLDRLVKQHPTCVAIHNVFPYSAANENLDGDRFLAPLWSSAETAGGWLENADVLIKIRNLWRFAISIDERYGPVYNDGVAQAIVEQINAIHPIPSSEDPSFKLILIGTSGGAQVALGAAPYLDRWLDVRLIMISVGGDFAGTEGFNAVDQVYHLQGDRDWIEDVSRIVFPTRWPWVVGSSFNQARRQNRYTVLTSGPHAHTGPTGYFGQEPIKPGYRTTYVDLTLQVVNQLPIWDFSSSAE